MCNYMLYIVIYEYKQKQACNCSHFSIENLDFSISRSCRCRSSSVTSFLRPIIFPPLDDLRWCFTQRLNDHLLGFNGDLW
jgi:hypothetical protein